MGSGGPGYAAEAVSALVAGGLAERVAHGLVAFYRPTPGQALVLVEVMDWLDAEALAGREEGVRSRSAWVKAALEAGRFDRPPRLRKTLEAARQSASRERAMSVERERAERERAEHVRISGERKAVRGRLRGWSVGDLERLRGAAAVGLPSLAGDRLQGPSE